jgi:cytosine/adenosine deaminase-related metal-dependent hydrolase
MADILIKHGVLIPVDPERQILPDGAVAIEKDRIVAVGPTAEVARLHPAAKVIDARGKAIVPGLIDAHAHAGHGLLKNVGGDRSDLWLEACEGAYTIGSTENFWRAEARLSALERLRFGVTTGVSFLGGGDTIMRTDDPVYGDAHCEGVLAVGTRSIVAVGTTRPPHPRTYARWAGDVPTRYEVNYERQIETCQVLADRWHGTHGERLRVALLTPPLMVSHKKTSPPEVFAEAVRQIKEVHALALQRGLLFMQDGHTRGSVAMADDFGILGPGTVLIHCIDLTDEEIRLCAKTRTAVIHNPSSIGSILGRCPVPELLEVGALVALGSDGTSPDRSGDMFRHMQLCMHYHRAHFRDPSWMPPGKVLEMCTIDAARALGLESEIGSLEVGKKADVVLIDLRRPHLYPANMPEYRITCFANGNDVDTVIVDGRVVLEGREAVLVDEEEILDDAQREAELVIKRLGLQRHVSTPELFWNHARGTNQVALWKESGWLADE